MNITLEIGSNLGFVLGIAITASILIFTKDSFIFNDKSNQENLEIHKK